MSSLKYLQVSNRLTIGKSAGDKLPAMEQDFV
jgi:hypothetical protein